MSDGQCKGEMIYGYDSDPYYRCAECGYVERSAPPIDDSEAYAVWREHYPSTHNDYTDEEYALGFEDCRCEPYPDEKTCVVCSERVKYMSHTHFKGQLFHDWCLMVAALKRSRALADSIGEGEK